MTRLPLRSFARDQSGQALIEFAMTLGIQLGFIFCLMQLCILFYTDGLIAECARQGTRYAIVRGSTCINSLGLTCTASADSINTYTSAQATPNIGGGAMRVTTTFPDGNQSPGSRVLVRATYALPVSFPFVPRQTFTLSASSQMYILQ